MDDNSLDWDEALTERDILIRLLEFSQCGARSEWLSDILLEMFNDIKGVLNAPTRELEEVEDLPHSFMNLTKLIRRLIILHAQPSTIPSDFLKNPKVMERYLIHKMKGLPAEQSLFIFLDNQGAILGEKPLGTGAISQSLVFPREAMRECLNHDASAVVVAHNHPHGPPIPSVADSEASLELKRLLAPFGVTLKDSIVVGARRCFSILSNRPL